MLWQTLTLLLTLLVVSLASHRLGHAMARARLPLITGFIAAGVLVGPFGLELISQEAVERLRFVDEVALAFIAFAAGAELYFEELRARLRSIAWISLGLVVSTFLVVPVALLAAADLIPFLAPMPFPARLAIALLAGAVLLARSPSSAIAIVNELRAHGPFTRTILGVTMLSDVVVIVAFAACSSFADAVLGGTEIDVAVLGLVGFEILLAIAVGAVVGRLLPLLGRVPMALGPKSALLAGLGYLSFKVGDGLAFASEHLFHFELFLEPLLICMVAGFVVANVTGYRAEFRRMLDLGGLPVYVVFFTLSGAAVELDTLARTWPIALLLFGVRGVAVFAGAWAGGSIAGDPARLNRISWLAFLTQAGISLGLAKEVAAEFGGWASSFATLMISVIVLNQFAGPPLFKWALQMAGEVRLRAGKRDLRGTPLCTIFGVDGEALALGRQLEGHGWRVKLVTRRAEKAADQPPGDVEIVVVADHGEEALRAAGIEESHTFVCLLSDDDSLNIARLAYEKLGTRNVVVQSQDRDRWAEYRDLGATVVDPNLALVSLLDHFVRSPSVAQLVLGMEPGQDVVDVAVENPDLFGLALRDLDLPQDTLVLSVRRGGASLISHGYTRLERGDHVTVMGSTVSLGDVQRHFAS